MTTADAKVELVARAICWADGGKDHDCNTECMAANACRGPLNECFLRDARAAITALEASHSMTEAMVDHVAAAMEEHATGMMPPYGTWRAVAFVALTAMQAARPIDREGEGVPASPSGCQPTASAAEEASSQSGIPNADKSA